MPYIGVYTLNNSSQEVLGLQVKRILLLQQKINIWQNKQEHTQILA